jgi:hypothetical protein
LRKGVLAIAAPRAGRREAFYSPKSWGVAARLPDVRPSEHSDAPVPRLLLAEWVHGDLPPEAVPQYATDALAHGCDTPTLRLLAGEVPPLTRADLDPLVRRCFVELGLGVPTPGEARAFVVDQWATLIAKRQVEPYVGAKRIWQIGNEWWGSAEWERTSMFVGLASQWEDDPQQRAAYEAEIISEAEKLVGEGGLRGRATA